MKIDDLQEVEAWKGGAYLGIGIHDVKCIKAEETTSSNDNPQIELEWESIAGEEKGSTIKDWIVVIPATLGKVKQMMEACGVDIPKGAFDLNVTDILGCHTRIVVRKENPGDKYPRVAAYTNSDLPLPDMDGLGADQAEDVSLPF